MFFVVPLYQSGGISSNFFCYNYVVISCKGVWFILNVGTAMQFSTSPEKRKIKRFTVLQYFQRKLSGAGLQSSATGMKGGCEFGFALPCKALYLVLQRDLLAVANTPSTLLRDFVCRQMEILRIQYEGLVAFTLFC